jgi:hypothetical protein
MIQQYPGTNLALNRLNPLARKPARLSRLGVGARFFEGALLGVWEFGSYSFAVVRLCCGCEVLRLFGCVVVVRFCGCAVVYFCGCVVVYFCGCVVVWL